MAFCGFCDKLPADDGGAISSFTLYWSLHTSHNDLCLSAIPPLWHTGWPKKLAHFLHALTSCTLTSSNIDRFSNLFHCLNRENSCNNIVAKDPTIPQLCRYTTLWNVSVLKATTENKTISVATHFKKLTIGNNVFIVKLLSKVTVTSCSVYIKCSMCPPCCWTTHY